MFRERVGREDSISAVRMNGARSGKAKGSINSLCATYRDKTQIIFNHETVLGSGFMFKDVNTVYSV